MEKQDDEQLFHEICLGNISLDDGQRVNRPCRHSFTASLSYAVTFLCSLNFTLLLKRVQRIPGGGGVTIKSKPVNCNSYPSTWRKKIIPLSCAVQ